MNDVFTLCFEKAYVPRMRCESEGSPAPTGSRILHSASLPPCSALARLPPLRILPSFQYGPYQLRP